MKKTLLFILAILASLSFMFAQTTATDFTVNDCDGVSHNLFSELDNGDVIVIGWTMPCPSCVNGIGYGADAVQSFATSHPGRVKYYMADDYGSTSCSSLSGWAMNYQIATDAIFSNAAIDMNDYGSEGMPKVVVLGKNNHKIYYNQNNNKIKQIDIIAAITLALSETVSVNDHINDSFALKAFPNPANEVLNLNFNATTTSQFDIIDVLGKVVLTHNTNENTSTTIDISTLEKGNYILRISNKSNSSNLKITISE